jgi:hypothetical protein
MSPSEEVAKLMDSMTREELKALADEYKDDLEFHLTRTGLIGAAMLVNKFNGTSEELALWNCLDVVGQMDRGEIKAEAAFRFFAVSEFYGYNFNARLVIGEYPEDGEIVKELKTFIPKWQEQMKPFIQEGFEPVAEENVIQMVVGKELEWGAKNGKLDLQTWILLGKIHKK